MYKNSPSHLMLSRSRVWYCGRIGRLPWKFETGIVADASDVRVIGKGDALFLRASGGLEMKYDEG
jgi:hypothetical protein